MSSDEEKPLLGVRNGIGYGSGRDGSPLQPTNPPDPPQPPQAQVPAQPPPPQLPPQAPPQLPALAQPPQALPLVPPGPPQVPAQPNKGILAVNLPFYVLCCITGQFFTDISDGEQTGHNVVFRAITRVLTVLSYIFCLLLLLVNVGSLAFDLYVIGQCPYINCTYFCTKYSNTHDLLDVYLATVTRRSPDDYNGSVSGLLGMGKESIEAYSNWNKTVITTATIAGFVSYYLMVFLVLLPLYSSLHKLLCKPCRDSDKYKKCLGIFCTTIKKSLFDNKDYLLPFDDGNSKRSTLLEPERALYFYLIYILNLCVFIGNLVLFMFIMVKRVTTFDKSDKDINETGLMCQFLSQFCAIQSCFIFSKVAYAMSNKCKDMTENFKKVDFSDGDFQQDNQNIDPDIRNRFGEINGIEDRATADEKTIDHVRVYFLKKLDEEFINQANASIKPYGHWFAIHWMLYTLTAFMSIAFFAETISNNIYIPHKGLWLDNRRTIISTSYIFLFTLEHIFLFLYPCFRAAQITRARVNLIKSFAKHSWKNLSIPSQAYFINYLSAQNFGFRMSIACIDVNFGFNLAFVFGVILKLSLWNCTCVCSNFMYMYELNYFCLYLMTFLICNASI